MLLNRKPDKPKIQKQPVRNVFLGIQTQFSFLFFSGFSSQRSLFKKSCLITFKRPCFVRSLANLLDRIRQKFQIVLIFIENQRNSSPRLPAGFPSLKTQNAILDPITNTREKQC